MPFDYLESVIKRFKQYKSLGDKTLEQLEEENLFWQYNDESNSIAIIVQHMHGNMLSRWTNFLTEDGEKEWRKRDDEFEEQKMSREKLLALWEEGWKCCLDSLRSLSGDDLERIIHIRNEPLSVVDAINRQIAHYSYHEGQIIY